MDREKAFLPAHQIFVEATKEHRLLLVAYSTINTKVNELHVTKTKILRERNSLSMSLRQAPEAARPEIKQKLTENSTIYGRNEGIMLDVNTERNEINNAIFRCDRILQGQDPDSGANVVETREFIQRCPAENCRGYLSTAYKCGTCAKYTCNECLAVKGDSRDVPHTCNEDAKASASLIRRETKPCPKCGVRIYKIDGCDQMFCTQETCHTAFSWRTGHVVTGVIHNPHYYEWLRTQNGGVVPREAGDIPCGGLPHYGMFMRIMNTATVTAAERTLLYSIHRCLNDMIHARLPEYPARRPANTNRDINIKYLMNEMSEDDWKKSLEQRETRFERKKELGQIMTTFAHVGSELLRALENAGTAGCVALWNSSVKQQINDLRVYTNKSLAECGNRMNCAFPQIDESWNYIPPRRTIAAKPVAPAVAVAVAVAPVPVPTGVPAVPVAVAPLPVAPAAVIVPGRPDLGTFQAARFDRADYVDDDDVYVDE
jgi:hypothetical protein